MMNSSLNEKAETQSAEKQLKCLMEMASQFYSQEKYVKAIETYLEAKELSEKTQCENSAESLEILGTIGRIYGEKLGEYEKAIFYLAKSKKLYDVKLSAVGFNPREETYESKLAYLNSVYRIGFYSQMLRKFEDAVESYQNFLVAAEKLAMHLPFLLVPVHYNLGFIYFELKNYQLALKQFEFAVDNAENAFGRASPEFEFYYRRLADAYLTLQQPKKAFEIYTELVSLAGNVQDDDKRRKMIAKYNEFIEFAKTKINDISAA